MSIYIYNIYLMVIAGLYRVNIYRESNAHMDGMVLLSENLKLEKPVPNAVSYSPGLEFLGSVIWSGELSSTPKFISAIFNLYTSEAVEQFILKLSSSFKYFFIKNSQLNKCKYKQVKYNQNKYWNINKETVDT